MVTIKQMTGRFAIVGGLSTALASNAIAQASMPALETGLTGLATALFALGLVLITIVVMYVGIMFWVGRGGEIAIRAFVGACIFAGAPIIAAWIMTLAGA